MLTSKQKAALRAQANGIDTVFQIGKAGLTNEVITQIRLAITPRELVKIKVLETSPMGAKEAGQTVATMLNADLIQVIGTKFVLFKRNEDAPKIIIE